MGVCGPLCALLERLSLLLPVNPSCCCLRDTASPCLFPSGTQPQDRSVAASIPQANGPKSQVLIRGPASKLPTSPSPCHYSSSALFPATSGFPQSGAPSQMQHRTCLRSVSSRQIWPVILACWGPSSNTSAVPSSLLSSANLIHMLSAALAKPLIKMTKKERAESRA